MKALQLPLPTGDLGLDIGNLQRAAADPAHSSWVSASAGSGKTKVLSDRVARLLLRGVLPQRILCLTFTKAAAAEMSVRLMNRLSTWATCGEEKLDAFLAELEGGPIDPARRLRARRLFALVLACPGGMRFQTIHSFAQELLSRFPLEAGVAPHFEVIEEAEAETLRREALHDAFEEAAEGKDEELSRALAHLVGLMAETSLEKILREVGKETARLEEAIARAGSLPALLENLRAALGLAADEDENRLRQEAVREGAFDREKLLQAGRALEAEGGKTSKSFAAVLLSWLEKDEAGRAEDLEAYSAALLTQDGTLRKNILAKGVLEKHPDVESVVKAEAERLSLLQDKLAALQMAAETRSLLTFALHVARLYADKKAARAALDYEDLVGKAEALLRREGIAPWVLYKLDGGIDHILLDETQDTNKGQWEIVRSLVDDYCAGLGARAEVNRTLFVVGDEKQSIYSFRGADAAMFFEAKTYFADGFKAAQKPFLEVPLNVSFRSAPAILRAVDAVFADEALRQGVSHAPVEHVPFRAQGAGRVELWPLFVEEEKGEAAQETWQPPASYETTRNPAVELADAIARKIRAWIEEGVAVYDRALGKERPVQAGDIMILVRKRDALVDHIVRALKAAHIPLAGVDRMVLKEQLAVMDLLALLSFALLPQDDLTLACVLRGPLIGASEEELMRLALGREGSLWESVKASDQKEIAAYLHGVLAKADAQTPLAMLMALLNKPCPADSRSGRRAILKRLGPEAEEAIDELLAAAEAFSARRSPSLQAFVQDMQEGETEVKRELEQAQGRVRLTSIHASKGLEAPICILPDTTSMPDRGKIPKLLWTEEGVPLYVPRETDVSLPQALREAAYEKQKEEDRRLLYVALTRAADRLVVCGHAKEKAKEGGWYALLSRAWGPLNQKETLPEVEKGIAPAILLADYALPAKIERPRKESGREKKSDLPAYFLAPPPPEPSPPRPLVPSRPSGQEPAAASPNAVEAMRRGKILHRLLQSLPELEPERRAAAGRRFLAHPQQALEALQQEETLKEVMALLQAPRFAPFFGPQSRAEVPLVGLAQGRLIAGQVDRLALVGEEVWILDYKTGHLPPEDEAVPAAYREQMEAYRDVLAQIYKGKKIRCFLLWTGGPVLVETGA